MGDAFLVQNIKKDDRKDGSSPAKAALSGFQLAQEFPNLSSGYYWIKSDSMPNALEMYVDMQQEGGGYDFYSFDGNGISYSIFDGNNSGIALGLDYVYPRSKQHWQAMYNFLKNAKGLTDSQIQSYFRVVNVYRTTGATGTSGTSYTGFVMRDPRFYPSGPPDWRVKDNGRWWLRDTTFGEPNGDYASGSLLGTTATVGCMAVPYTGQDMTFNDLNNFTNVSGSFYLVSTNKKP
jgi:hypothetical protein